jgi:putative transposase
LAEWDVGTKRTVALKLVKDCKYDVKLVCELLGLARSTFYYQGHGHDHADAEAFKAALIKKAGQHPTEGYRHLRERLRRLRRWKVTSRGRVQRWMQTLKIQRKRRRKPKRTTNSQHGFARYANLVKDLIIDRPNQVWVCDITWIKLANGEEAYLAIIMDVFTRKIVGWALGQQLRHELPLAALRRAFKQGTPEIHHSDQGVQYACEAYTQHLLDRGVNISMAAVGKAWENGYAERVIGTIKLDEVDLSEYADFQDALRQLGRFIDTVYNKKRIHSSLGYLTPLEFELLWRMQQRQNQNTP